MTTPVSMLTPTITSKAAEEVAGEIDAYNVSSDTIVALLWRAVRAACAGLGMHQALVHHSNCLV
jgi:hypothetical protein